MHNVKVMSYILFEDFTEYYKQPLRKLWGTVPRSKGEARIYRSFCWKQKHVVEHQKMTANHKNQTSQVIILVLFCVWEDARVWAHWNYSFDMHLNYLGLVSCFLHPEFPSRGTTELGGWSWEHTGYSGCWVDAGNLDCLLDWQATFLCLQNWQATFFFVRTCMYVIELWFSPVNMSHVNFNS